MNLSTEETEALSKAVEDMGRQQQEDSYNVIAKRCFMSCVADIGTKTLSVSECDCVQSCVQSFLYSADRLSQRYTEQISAPLTAAESDAAQGSQ